MNRALALMIALLLSACATAKGAQPSQALGDWQFVSIDGHKPVSGKTSLTIAPGRIGANVGCNGLGGDLRIEGNRLMAGPLISTMMYCDGVMEQERAVSELLAANPEFRFENGRLLLSVGKHSAELKPAS
jgi:heat shock protein HslJ